MNSRLKQTFLGYSFLLPSLVAVLAFSMLPLLASIVVSFTDWNYAKGFGNWNFVGLSNYADLWKDEWFIVSIKNTIFFTIATVPVGLILALVIAILIDYSMRDRLANILRVTMYMPNICNIVATSAVWMMMLSPYGPFTQMVRALGWSNPPKWLADYDWALPAIMLVSIWSNLGYRVFIYGASIQGVPSDIYEAAEIDGANFWQRSLYVTVPLLAPTTFFLSLTGIIASFKVFGTINVMTQGGPGNSTYTLVYYIYKAAFSYYKMGYASSIAVVLFIMLLIITIIQWTSKSQQED